METSPLAEEIRRRIARAGPMPVRQFMSLCLGHPKYGYYMTRDPFGRGGDFITAPESSQMFGELIGLWSAAVWRLMGMPRAVNLVELGPGRGTMLRDALRAAAIMPGFRDALILHLIEVSPELRLRQEFTLDELEIPRHWYESLDEVPEGPLIVVANEFFDALPVHQAVKQINGWYERTVEIDKAPDAEGRFVFGVSNEPIPQFEQTLTPRLRDAPIGSIYEWREQGIALELSRRLVRDGGAALIIDYGHTHSAIGETLQAIADHAYADPLAAPGLADLTAHVDFEALAWTAESMGAKVHGPVDQSRLLQNLGLDQRAAALRIDASESQAADIDAAVARLTAPGRQGMGALFKALALSDPKLQSIPGFED